MYSDIAVLVEVPSCIGEMAHTVSVHSSTIIYNVNVTYCVLLCAILLQRTLDFRCTAV